MTLENLPFYTAAGLNAGINVNAASITMGPQAINALPLSAATINMSYGYAAGLTPRYGIFPVPGHNSLEEGAIISGGVYDGLSMRNLVASEQTYNRAGMTLNSDYDLYDTRKFILGAATVQLPVGSGGATVPVVYWISTRNRYGANPQIDLVPSCQVISTGQKVALSSQLEAGVGDGTAHLSYCQGNGEIGSTCFAVDRLHLVNLADFRSLTTHPNFIRWTTIQTQILTNMNELVGQWTGATAPPGTTPIDINFGYYGSPYWNNGKKQKRNISFTVGFVIGSGGTAPKKWAGRGYFSATYENTISLVGVAATSRSPVEATTLSDYGTGTLQFSGFTSTLSLSGSSADTFGKVFCRFDDQPATVPLTIIAMITSHPIIVAFNPMVVDSTAQNTFATATTPRTNSNDFAQWIDPCNNFWKPRSYNTVISDLTTPYTETWAAAGGVAVAQQTCWAYAPAFVFGTATGNVVSGAASPGLLKGNTVYEYAYSVYNTLTGKESNVGSPARAFVTTDDSAIQITKPAAGARGVSDNTMQFPSQTQMLNEAGITSYSAMPINHMHFRLYYREVGSFEWLFAGEHSFAKVYYEAYGQAIYIGATSAVGEVGGQPGGYNDYSDLPVDDYVDVSEFNGRLFWLTKQSLRYSLKNDVFSYPATNYATAATGEFLGMIVHKLLGQAESRGRLVVFSSAGQFEGRFTGDLQYTQVRVSATAGPQSVPVDGSDFDFDMKSTDTAFSARAAVVAEGILYYMGPTGIFRDDGINTPVRISQAIEPDYFRCYNPYKSGEFFAYYNRPAREIIFYYRPNPASPDLNPQGYLTKAWVYSVRTEQWDPNPYYRVVGAFTQYGYTSLIDWAQDFDYSKTATASHVPGPRCMVGIRASSGAAVSRPYFHDSQCDSGDYAPGLELMVKQIQKPDSSTFRLVLAAGYSTAAFNAITAGVTKIAIKSSTAYGDMLSTLNLDGYYTVKAKGTGTIDIAITGTMGSVSPQSFTVSRYFPIFVEGVHSFSAVLDPHYLSPEGLTKWQLVRYMHLLIKPVSVPQGDGVPTLTAEWSANHEISATMSVKTLPVSAMNAREETTQLLTDIPSGQMQAEAQAVKPTLTYNSVAGRWTLYAMTHYYNPARGDGQIKYYQRA